MSERWLLVPGWSDYEVSDRGRVRSIKFGRIKLLQLVRAKSGHLKVHLRDNQRERNEYVHRLVLLAFVGPCPNGGECRHYPDRHPANNKLSNLSWATVTVNQRDRIAHGTHNRGMNGSNAKLTDANVRAIRKIKDWRRGMIIELARKYGVHRSTIEQIKHRKTWKGKDR